MKKLLVLILLLIAATVWLWLDGDAPAFWESEDPSVPAELVSESPVHDEETPAETVAAPASSAKAPVGEVVRFFYEQLEPELQHVYRELRDGVYREESEILLSLEDAETVFVLYQLVLFDYPEFFWVTGSGNTIVTTRSDGSVYVTFSPEYAHTGEVRQAMQAEIDAVVDAFLSTLDPNLTEFELVLAVYEYIVLMTDYNLDAPDHQNIYSVFVNRASVCAGISRATQHLLNQLGIFNVYVTGVAYVPGTSRAPIAHAWNLVRLDGEYYHLDVTWGSPNFQNTDLFEHAGIVYDYFLVNDENLFRTHTVSEQLNLPAATSLRHNYFVVNGMFYENPTEEALLEAMNASIVAGESGISFQFATPELFLKMRPLILEDLAPHAARNLAEWYGLDRVSYMIREKENLNKMTIYWMYE